MHTFVTNMGSLWEVTVAALIFGAGLPVIFAVGVRLWSMADTVAPEGGGVVAQRNHAALAGALACFAIIIAAIIVGILFLAKAFLASHFGIHLFGES